jgi:hypothetical protein
MTDPVPSKKRDIADDLLEAVTVLGEPSHREAVAGTIGRAAGVINRLRSDLEELHDAHDTLERKLDSCGVECSATMKSLLAENERLRTTLTGISTCSTCEACRGAAQRALGGEPTKGCATKFEVGDRVQWTNHLNNTFRGMVRHVNPDPHVIVQFDDGTLRSFTESELRAAQPPGDVG